MEQAKKLGTENIEKVLKGALEISKAIKGVVKDGKVDASDLAPLLGLVNKVGELVEAVKSADDALAEIKDIDIVEVVALIQKVDSLVKEFEKA